jgi:hypothetical protein
LLNASVLGPQSVSKLSDTFISFLSGEKDFFGFMFDDSQSMHNFDFGWDTLMDILKNQNYKQINQSIMNPNNPEITKMISIGSLHFGKFLLC